MIHFFIHLLSFFTCLKHRALTSPNILLCVFVRNTSPFRTSLISTYMEPFCCSNVAAGEHCSCEGSFMVFRAWHTRVSALCPPRKCRERSFPGWSHSLIHSALLDLRLAVQLLPINVKTREKGKNTQEEEEEEEEAMPVLPPVGSKRCQPARHNKAGRQKLFILLKQQGQTVILYFMIFVISLFLTTTCII